MGTAVHTSAVVSTRVRQSLVITAAALCVLVTPRAARAGDPVMEWNDIARQLSVVPALSSVAQTRVMAIVHVAVHDAVNAITGKYEQYQRATRAPSGASPEAAAIAAAHHALKGVFGDSEFLATRYAASLEAHGISPSDSGVAFGESVAEGILLLRLNDGAAVAAYPYVAPDAGMPGVWVPVSSAPSAQALLPGWGHVTPFVLRRGSQFRPGPPPHLESERYARDYNEVFQAGALAGSIRTNEQTQIALFWRASPTALWNPVLR